MGQHPSLHQETKGTILILDLDGTPQSRTYYLPFLHWLQNFPVNLYRGYDAEISIDYMHTKSPNVIIIADEGIAHAKNAPLLQELRKYASNGGTIIIGFDFPVYASPEQFRRTFRSLGVGGWTRGSFKRARMESPFEFYEQDPWERFRKAWLERAFAGDYGRWFQMVEERGRMVGSDGVGYCDGGQTTVFFGEANSESEAAIAIASVEKGEVVYVGGYNAGGYSDAFLKHRCQLETGGNMVGVRIGGGGGGGGGGGNDGGHGPVMEQFR